MAFINRFSGEVNKRWYLLKGLNFNFSSSLLDKTTKSCEVRLLSFFWKIYSKTIMHPGATSCKTIMHPGTMSNSLSYSEASMDKENLSTGDDVESTNVSATTSDKSAMTNKRPLPQTAGGCEKAAKKSKRPSAPVKLKMMPQIKGQKQLTAFFRAWIFKMSCFDV